MTTGSGTTRALRVAASILTLAAAASCGTRLGRPEASAGRLAVTLAAEPGGHGGGEYVLEADSPDLSEEQRAAIWEMLRDNIAKLQAEGVIPDAPATRATHPTLTWPLRAAPHLRNYGYHAIRNYVDHDPSFPGFVLDYECGDRTYDTGAGYNHQGTDFFNWPFPWLKMDRGDVEIIAAAPGVITVKQDGNFDRSCASNSNEWNSVGVQHADGSFAWYGHVKNGSLTAKLVGESVERGEYLGIVGSSGSSPTPHLHFAVWDSESNPNDPFQGPCNSMNSTSWWAVQPPSYDSAVNHVATSFAAPVFPPCPDQEDPNEASDFNFGDTLYFAAYYRHQLPTRTATYTVRRPDGSVYDTWTHHSDFFFLPGVVVAP